MNLANSEEVYLLWDSADELMCDVETPHQVDFKILFHNKYIVNEDTNDRWKNEFGISYQGEIISILDETLFKFELKDLPLTLPLERLEDNDSNVLYRFVLPMMLLLRVKQDVLNQLPPQVPLQVPLQVPPQLCQNLIFTRLISQVY